MLTFDSVPEALKKEKSVKLLSKGSKMQRILYCTQLIFVVKESFASKGLDFLSSLIGLIFRGQKSGTVTSHFESCYQIYHFSSICVEMHAVLLILII